MITTKLLRAALALIVVALVSIVVLEVHWSVDTKSNAGAVARESALAGAHILLTEHDGLNARHAAEVIAATHGLALVAFSREPDGDVRVTVSGRARSYLLRRLAPTRSISEVTATATASPR